MRNILEYPMTASEAIEILIGMKEELNKSPSIGDIRPYAIDWIIEKLQITEGGDHSLSINFLF